jgi:integrase
MATVNFLIQTEKNPSKIYIRFKDGRKFDIQTTTNFIINPEDWSQSKQRPKSLKSESFKTLDTDLQNLKTNLQNCFNSSSDVIDLNWLKNFLNPLEKLSIPKDLVSYFDFYIKERGKDIDHRTTLKINVVKNKIIKIQKEKQKTFLISEVNQKFKNDFESWNLKNGYASNTILSNLKEVKAMCIHARKKGLAVSWEMDEIKVTQKKAVSIYLNEEDILKIDKAVIKIKSLQDARDWLLISCYTAQRVSDFMRFRSSMIRKENGIFLIEFTQMKTGKIMTLPLQKKVIEILNKRDFEFPDRQTDPKYNVNIKNVCKKAKIENIVYGGKMEKSRKVFKEYPKHELVTSHIGRRSFATNNYGKIPTPLLMAATGHGTEAVFLTYIGKSSSEKAIELSKYF